MILINYFVRLPVFDELVGNEQIKDMELVFATNNKNKIKEIEALLNGKFKILSLSDIGCYEDIPETSDTLAGNAFQKAAHVKEKYGYDCFADDTGLEIEELQGEPGVYTARYAGPECSAYDNMEKVLSELKGKTNRKAQFITVISLLLGNESLLFEGVAKGEITNEKIGEEGFGYDPIFMPEQYDRTFSQMTMEEKNKISHRGKATRKLIGHLQSLSDQ